MFGTWFALATEGALLGLDAQRVILLRTLKIAAGGTAASTEVVRMMTEKMTAAIEANTTLATGGSGRKVVRRYRTRVKENVRRLSGRRRRGRG
jgi:hypothetical protein